MTRRFVRFAPLLLLLLAGCVTYSDGYYRDGYYSDGGYYYPAEDGYGDYYAGPDYDYYDYGYSTYTPFWGLDRYGCGAWSSCSPYWNSYYRRPYGGWSLSFDSHWSYGHWGWYGRHWAPWYGHHDHYRPWPRHRDPAPTPGPGPDLGAGPAPGQDGTTRPPFRTPGVTDPAEYEPNEDSRPPGRRLRPIDAPGEGAFGRPEYRPGQPEARPAEPRPRYPQPPIGDRGEYRDPVEAPVRAMPRSDFRETRWKGRPMESADTDPSLAQPPGYGSLRQPQRPPSRYERPAMREPASSPGYERPAMREPPRYERPAMREPAPPPARYERPVERESPRPAPRAEPPMRREMGPASQNDERDDEL